MDLDKLDLNLLVVFDAMVRHRNVTAAGKELGLSQPAASYALEKMRKSFGDALFVRVGTHMQPTARALTMVDTVRDVLQQVRVGMLSTAEFDPARSHREFRIATSDIGDCVIVPPLVRAFRTHGEHLKLAVLALTPEALHDHLESGAVDLAVGYYPDLVGADYFKQALYTSHFVAIAARDNPHTKDKLTMARFLQAPHVDIATPGHSQEVVLRHIGAKQIARKVQLRVPRFMGLQQIVSQSDLIAIVPNKVAESFRDGRGLTIHPLPFASPTFRVQQHWHRRFHDESSVRWLRKLVHRLFSGGVPPFKA